MALPMRFYTVDQVTGESRRCPTAGAWSRWMFRYEDATGGAVARHVHTDPPATTGVPLPAGGLAVPGYDLWEFPDGLPV